MEKVLVSACLLGSKVRYDSAALSMDTEYYNWLASSVLIVPFCPEVSAGLPVPRAPAEILYGEGTDVLSGNAEVKSKCGIDFTAEFIYGARLALKKCHEQHIKFAVLSENSPSCGSTRIYDGQFQGTKKSGRGVTAALLFENGISIYSQHALSELRSRLEAGD